MGLSRNKVAVSEGAAGSPPFYGERVARQKTVLRSLKVEKQDKTNDGDSKRVQKGSCCSIFKDQRVLER